MGKYSRRVEERFLRPKFKKKELEKISPLTTKEDFLFSLDLTREGTVKSIYYQTSLPPSMVAVIEGLIELSSHKTPKQLSEISWREVESYLRDSNLEPALPQAEFNLPLYTEILTLFRWEMYRQTQEPLRPYELNWKELTLKEKISSLEKMLNTTISPALKLDGGGILLMDLQPDTIWLKFTGQCEHCAVARNTTWDFIQKTLTTYWGKLPLTFNLCQ